MTVEAGTPVLVLHDVGEERGGSDWLVAFEVGGWPGPVLAPDLPGHAGQPAGVGGAYELADAAFVSLGILAGAGNAGPPLVVGVGVNGWSAQILALGGRAAGLVLVDGLNGPWEEPVAAVAAGRQWVRDLAADPDAMAPAPPGASLDPRLRHKLRPHGDRVLAERAAVGLTLPVLVVESPRSPLAPAERAGITDLMPAVSVVELAESTPAAVAEATRSWWEAVAPA